jgi:hypothetical protein
LRTSEKPGVPSGTEHRSYRTPFLRGLYAEPITFI